MAITLVTEDLLGLNDLRCEAVRVDDVVRAVARLNELG